MEEEIKEVNYEPTEKQSKVVNRVWDRFVKMQEERDKKRRYFDGRTLTQYVNDNVDAYNGIVPDEIKETKEAWQSLIFDQKTRGKVKAVVALVTSGRPFVNLIGKTREDDKNADDIRLVFEDSHQQEEGQYKLYMQTLSCAVKGTVIVEEGYEEKKKTVKKITSINPETGKVKYKKETIIEGGAGHCYSKIVPLLNFYPNENCSELKHDCIVMEYPTQEVFDKRYGKYDQAKYVKPGITYDNIDNIEYKSVKEDRNDIIEVMKYYNEDLDEFVILANGVWLNPQDDDEVCPLPYNHKHLPFVKTVFEPADEDVFYGKALPDLMAGEQETINALLRMTVDQEVLSIHKPILMGNGAELDSYQMFPGKTFRTTGSIEDIRELDISGTQNSTFQILEWLDKKSDVNTAVSANTMGVHSGKKTAKEATLLDENAKRLSGNFQTFIYHLLFHRAKRRVSNICQFYRQPVQYSALKDKYGNPIRNKAGEEITRPVYREVPISKPGKKPFWVNLTPDKCDSQFIIKLVEDIEPSMTRQQQLEVATAMLEESKQNPLMDADEVTINWILKLGSNPDRFYIKPKPKEMAASINGTLKNNQGAMGGAVPQQA